MGKKMEDSLKRDWTSPPGHTIADLLEERNWTQAQLADRLGVSRKHVNELITGKATISDSNSIKLARVLGSTVGFWLNREAGYRAALADQQAIEQLRDVVSWLDELPVSHMRKMGWIRSYRDKAKTVSECLQFFGVGSVDAWRSWSEGLGQTAYRMSDSANMAFGSIATWLRFGEIQASTLECEDYSKDVFKTNLASLRALTLEPDPDVFVPRMIKTCSDAGIAVVFEPTPRGCPASGATRWLAPNKALLMLSLRYKTNDHLWFTFFHEAAHILLHRKKLMFLELNQNGNGEEEAEANQFAADLLIPSQHLDQLRTLANNRAEVSQFARKLGIPPGIVVGRMQYEGILPHGQLNDLKVKYAWA